MSSPAAGRTDVEFRSGGTRIAAYLYRPVGSDAPVPCVVMAHGFTATREQALPAYAERFAAAGLAALLFDYRFFGASDGEPRQLLDIGAQHDDFRAAVAYARALDGIDPGRIALWGSSFSGGHVVAVAAGDPSIAAVVAQVPFADGRSAAGNLPRTTAARLGAVAIADQVGAWLGRPPRLVPAVGQPGSFATLTDPQAESGFRSIDPPASLWRNEYAARLMLRLWRYRPITAAPSLAMPLFVSIADRDATVPPGPAVKMAQAAPRGEMVRYPIGHFEIYTGAPFETAVAAQVEFLRRHLL